MVFITEVERFFARYALSPDITQIRFVFKRLSSQEVIDESICFNVPNADNTICLIFTSPIRHIPIDVQ
jgi:hypothetical protein